MGARLPLLRVAIALVALAVLLPCATASAIYGGYQADASKFPSFVFLDYGRPYLIDEVARCGGVLIAPNAVLSARHCFQGHWPKKASFRRNEGGLQKDFLVPRAVLHPTADLAIAILEGQATVAPMGLVAARPAVGKWMTGIGFGCAARPVAPKKPGDSPECNSTFPTRLKALPLQRVTPCQPLPTSKFCVSGPGSLGPGDSGGPVMSQQPDGRWLVAGLVSTADSYQAPYRAGITSVAELRPWIQTQLAALTKPGSTAEPSPSTPAPSTPAPSTPAPVEPAPASPTTPAPAPAPSPPTEFYYSVYGTCADGACGLRIRSGPGYSSFPQIGRLSDGDRVAIVCQTTGETVGPSPATGNSSAIWDRLSGGGYVSDLYITTPAVGRYTPGIPVC